ncbi:MAG: GntR family transcriptional regulator [Phycisphaerae bacterium]|nr:GntR family transcriptional regulator [Phycisphaerae bacterium]
MFVRIEPSSSVPIYRQIIDQIRYQVATGVLQPGDRVPSVRALAGQLAVNQNTILKVFNELRNEKILRVERGSGTVVAQSGQSMTLAERKKTVATLLREGAIQAIQLDIPKEQAVDLLQMEYEIILSEKKRSQP